MNIERRINLFIKIKSNYNLEHKKAQISNRAYEVTYVDDCHQIFERECKLFENFLCDKVKKTKCRKVAQFPTERCQNIPRMTETCQDIPVRRSLGQCKLQCVNQFKKKCKTVTKNVCKDVPVQVPVCQTIPNKKCKIDKVKRLKLIPKKICTALKPTEAPKLSLEN